jgi:quercetin dioxygenase-like cupin family protein
MTLVRATDAPIFSLHGATFTGLAAPSRGARETAVWRVSIDADAPAAAHFLDHEEVFVALRGAAIAHVGDATHHVAAGDALIVASHTQFDIAVDGDAPFEAIVAFPVGGKAWMLDGDPFTPPWAE